MELWTRPPRYGVRPGDIEVCCPACSHWFLPAEGVVERVGGVVTVVVGHAGHAGATIARWAEEIQRLLNERGEE